MMTRGTAPAPPATGSAEPSVPLRGLPRRRAAVRGLRRMRPLPGERRSSRAARSRRRSSPRSGPIEARRTPAAAAALPRAAAVLLFFFAGRHELGRRAATRRTAPELATSRQSEGLLPSLPSSTPVRQLAGSEWTAPAGMTTAPVQTVAHAARVSRRPASPTGPRLTAILEGSRRAAHRPGVRRRRARAPAARLRPRRADEDREGRGVLRGRASAAAVTLGSPIAIGVVNRDHANWETVMGPLRGRSGRRGRRSA